MIQVSESYTEAPPEYKTALQKRAYEVLQKLNIPFRRVETDEVITMADCAAVNEKLGIKMVKTLFLCDRKQIRFYLFITAGGKPFKSKEFAAALGVSQLSFAPAGKMEEMLGTIIGAATIFSALLKTAENVQIIIDKDVAEQEWYGCSDGTTTGYMKIKTEYIIKDLLTFAKKEAAIIKV